jgi:hypothetical protein
MADADGDSLGITTKWFDLKAGGPLVIMIILGIVMNGAITYLLMEQTKTLGHEHREITDLLELVDCRMNLDIYINTIGRDAPTTWYKMPKELRPCLPQYLMERENGQKARAKE